MVDSSILIDKQLTEEVVAIVTEGHDELEGGAWGRSQ
jgi:hypothetical protein